METLSLLLLGVFVSFTPFTVSRNILLNKHKSCVFLFSMLIITIVINEDRLVQIGSRNNKSLFIFVFLFYFLEAISCDKPEIKNANKIEGKSAPYKYNNFVRYRCNKGYRMEGSDTVSMKCTERGWDPAPPTCEGTNNKCFWTAISCDWLAQIY